LCILSQSLKYRQIALVAFVSAKVKIVISICRKVYMGIHKVNRQTQGSSQQFALVIIVSGFLLLGSFYSWLVPPFEGPDEAQHFAYITWLAEGKGFPPQDKAWETPIEQEAGQPPFYYLLAAIPAHIIGTATIPAIYRPNPYFPSNAPGMVPDNKNVAIHYPEDIRPLQGGWLALYLARGLSLLWGVSVIVLIYEITKSLFPLQLALATTALVAMTPQVVFLSTVVSNDIAAAALSTATLWLLLRIVQEKGSTKMGLLLGCTYGLAALTKANNLLLALPITAVWLWLWRSKIVTLAQYKRMGTAFVIGAFATGGWWYLWTWRLYGSPFGLQTHCFAPWAHCGNALLRDNVWYEWQEVYFSYWAAFGWGNIKWPGWVYGVWGLFLLVALAGVALTIYRRWHDKQMMGLLGICSLTLLISAVSLEMWMRQVTAPHGRLLFPALAAVAILLVIGWYALWPYLPWIAVGVMALLTLASSIWLIRPAYAWPQVMPDMADGLGWRFSEMVDLISVTPMQESARAGEVLPIRTCWHTLATAPMDYSMLIHLIGPENRVVAGRHTYPGLGRFPTSAWLPDYTFCDTILVDIPRELAQTLLYKVEIGWLDHETGERLTAIAKDGTPLSHTFAATVRLQSAETEMIELAPPYSNTIVLKESDLPQVWQAGEEHTFILKWWLSEAVSVDYTTFVHLRHPDTGQNVAQADGPPANGWYPTSIWQTGEVIVDERKFLVPKEIAAGMYDLVVGWYDPDSGVRLEEYFVARIAAKS
jgi:4-amino-4-deoxy-L-arabinose transferase-like glycosyltransferase